MKRLSLSLFLAIFYFACTPEPQPIHYGDDYCSFCKMTIVDPRFGAELVTDKGKVFKFDAIECMIQYVQQDPEQVYAYLLVNDYESPGELIDAHNCSYLISNAVPSPMGAYLSAYENSNRALAVQRDKGGDTYDWEQLLRHFRDNSG